MKKLKGVFLILFALLIISINPIKTRAADNGYYIKNMSVDVEVNDKREYIVTETIDVYFNESRHGIIRKIPTKGSLEEYEVNDIKASGESSFTQNNGYIDLKIGDENTTVVGDKRYHIQYTLAHKGDGQSDGDYIYINLLGTEWDTRIEKFRAILTYPNTGKLLDLTITDGPYGSKSNTYVTSSIYDNKVIVESDKVIPEKNGITLNIKLEDGVFINAPKSASIFRNLISKWKNTIIAVTTLEAIIIVGALFFYFRNRRDTSSPISFYPPKDMNSAEVGYLYNLKITSTDMTSLITYWASHNHLKIVNEGEDIKLIKISDLDYSHKEYEIDMFNSLFSYGTGGWVKLYLLEGNYYNDINRGKKALRDEYEEAGGIISKKSRIAFILAIISSLLPIVSLVLIGTIGQGMGVVLMNLGVIIFLSIIIISMSGTLTKAKLFRDGVLGEIIQITFILIFFVIFTSSFMQDVYIPIWMRIVIPAISFILLQVSTTIQSIDEIYDEEYEEILGFRNFIKVAEKERLESLLSEDPEYFYNTLPFAQVLGVTDKWVDRFSGIAMEPPSYYESSNFYVGNIISDINSLTRVGYSPTTGRGSGGDFSGGGFSGGGSGGGGGSSW